MSVRIDQRKTSSRVGALPAIAITGGGTGGHVYPALAIAYAIQQRSEGTRVIYVGSAGGMEGDLARRVGLPFCQVATGALRGRSALAKLDSVGKLASGVTQALFVLRQHRIRAVLATGGYVSVPVAVAAALARIPSAIYLPDVEPGLAVRFLSTFAQRVAVTCERSRGFLPPAKVVVTGYPLRPDLLARPDRKTARLRMGIAEAESVLLVLGGSRGAHSINAALAKALPDLLARAVVLHSSGAQDEAWLRQIAAGLPAHLAARYHLWPYLDEELPSAMAAADLALSRSGASVMGEYPWFGLPSVLVPYPYAGAHQERNADYLVNSGAAVKLLDENLNSLLPSVTGLLGDTARLAGMRSAARSLGKPDAANVIAGEVLNLCSRR